VQTYQNVDDDPASLAANRAGQITPQQRKRVSRLSVLVGLPVLVGAIWFFLIMGVRLPGVTWETLTTPDQSAPLSLRLLLALAALFPDLIVGGVAIWACIRLSRWLRLEYDLSQGAIAYAQGQVTFSSKGYLAAASGRRFLALNGNRVINLAPGAYRFYYLRASRRLLSAEPLARYGAAQPQAPLLETLASVHGFSLGDLAMNRQGWLSARQRSKLLRAAVLWVGFTVAGALALLLWMPDDLELTGIVILLIFALLLLYIGYTHYADMLAGRVAMLEGVVVSNKRSGDEGGYTYHYVIGRESFLVSESAYLALISGLPYRVYYGPKSKKLLSIEPLVNTPVPGYM
jgi:hypothetical protein